MVHTRAADDFQFRHTHGLRVPDRDGIVNAIDSRPTPRLWAVNGAAGVLAVGLAVLSALRSRSAWHGAAFYLLLGPVAVSLSRGRDTERAVETVA